jgi:hypothetical protein
VIKEFVDEVRKVGPSPLRDGSKGKKAAGIEVQNEK